MYIYVIAPDTADSPCKIGASHNPSGRAQTLSTGSPWRLVVKHSVECSLCGPDWSVLRSAMGGNPWKPVRDMARAIEKGIHKNFADKRMNGEWFDLDWHIAASFIDEAVNKARSELCD